MSDASCTLRVMFRVSAACVVAALALVASGCGGGGAPCSPANTLNHLTELEPVQEDLERRTLEFGRDVTLSKDDVSKGSAVLYSIVSALIEPRYLAFEVLMGVGFDSPYGPYFEEGQPVESFYVVYERDCAGDPFELSVWEKVPKAQQATVNLETRRG